MARPLIDKVLSRKNRRPQKFYALVRSTEDGISFNQADEDFLWEVYCFAREAHRGQLRKSGEPYFEHPYQTARILAEMNMEPVTVACGLLHDVIEDTNVRFEDLETRFGLEVAKLVEGVTKISGISFRNRQEEQADNFRKMLLSVAEDIRVLISNWPTVSIICRPWNPCRR